MEDWEERSLLSGYSTRTVSLSESIHTDESLDVLRHCELQRKQKTMARKRIPKTNRKKRSRKKDILADNRDHSVERKDTNNGRRILRIRAKRWIGTTFIHVEPCDLFNACNELKSAFHRIFPKMLRGRLESCPNTGRIHLHFALVLESAISFTKLREHLHNVYPGVQPAHLEKMRGTTKQAVAYFNKNNDMENLGMPSDFFNIGEDPVEPGKQRITDQVKKLLDEGYTTMQIAQKSDDLFSACIRGHHFFDRYQLAIEPKIKAKPSCLYVFIGETGSGKTRMAHYLSDRLCIKPEGEWFDGLENQSCLLYDDIQAGRGPPIEQLKRLADYSNIPVPVKGGFRSTYRLRKIILTSNYMPNQWYSDGISRKDSAALTRRTVLFWVMGYNFWREGKWDEE